MIKRFSTLYIGHIELENCGHSGTPADDRRYSNERVIEAFDTTLELARTMDERRIGVGVNSFEHPIDKLEERCTAVILGIRALNRMPSGDRRSRPVVV